jgi:hypothetical protein
MRQERTAPGLGGCAKGVYRQSRVAGNDFHRSFGADPAEWSRIANSTSLQQRAGIGIPACFAAMGTSE